MPGWAIPKGKGFRQPPKGESCIRRTAWGAQSPPGRAGSGWCQAGREETVPRGCWSERYTPPPRAKPGCYWLLRDTGTPSYQPPWWAGIPRRSQCQCPLLTLAPIPEQREGGRLREVSWWAGSGEGLWGQRPGSGRDVKGEGQPGLGRPPPVSTHPVPFGLTLVSLKPSAPLGWDGGGGVSDILVIFPGLVSTPLPQTQNPHHE